MKLTLNEQALQHYIKTEAEDLIDRVIEISDRYNGELSEDDAIELIRQEIVRLQAQNKAIEELLK